MPVGGGGGGAGPLILTMKRSSSLPLSIPNQNAHKSQGKISTFHHIKCPLASGLAIGRCSANRAVGCERVPEITPDFLSMNPRTQQRNYLVF